MNLIKRGEAQLMETNSKGGQIRIGASDTICRYFLVPYLERFHKEFPGAHIKVTNATSIRCVELLESGQVDLIVVNYPNPYLGNITGVRKDVYKRQILNSDGSSCIPSILHASLL